MGRPVFYRQRVRSQAASVQAKSLMTHLASEIRARRGLAGRGLAHCFRYHSFLGTRPLAQGPGQIMLPCVAGLRATSAGPADQTEKLVKLTVLVDGDASL